MPSTKQHTRSKDEYEDVEDALADLREREPFDQLQTIEDTDGEPVDHTREDLEDLEYSELQSIAKDLEIKANQSTDDLIDGILDADTAGQWVFTVNRSGEA
jgi:hypothetical protein